ncbi:MAG: ferritin-like domain-containing protein [Acidimicrobiia bacterium]
MESQDLQADALRQAKAQRRRFVEVGRARQGRPVDVDQVRMFRDQRRHVLRNGGFGLGALAAKGILPTAFGTAVLGIVARPVSAQENVDVQILNTASSLENLAVATYEAALGLPFIANGNAIVKAFAETTMSQHAEHSAAFNDQAESLGGPRQDNPNPVLAPTVEQAKATLTDPLAVAELAAMLEEVAADTYLANLSLLSDSETKGLMGSVMGVEVQHLATLRAVIALLEANAPEFIAIPTDLANLPGPAGSVAFPEALPAPDLARSAEEGAA